MVGLFLLVVRKGRLGTSDSLAASPITAPATLSRNAGSRQMLRASRNPQTLMR